MVSLVLVTPSLAESRTGKVIYTATCAMCHAAGVANAPKPHDTAAWQARNKDLAGFVESAKKGLNAMPPYGTCADCSDEELKAVIEFMMKEEK